MGAGTGGVTGRSTSSLWMGDSIKPSAVPKTGPMKGDPWWLLEGAGDGDRDMVGEEEAAADVRKVKGVGLLDGSQCWVASRGTS
jgi:hypothetical protein